jgi:hypothetical protein
LSWKDISINSQSSWVRLFMPSEFYLLLCPRRVFWWPIMPVYNLLCHGIIFWRNSTYSNLIFKIQKRTFRIIMKARNTDSYCPLFRLLNIIIPE